MEENDKDRAENGMPADKKPRNKNIPAGPIGAAMVEMENRIGKKKDFQSAFRRYLEKNGFTDRITVANYSKVRAGIDIIEWSEADKTRFMELVDGYPPRGPKPAGLSTEPIPQTNVTLDFTGWKLLDFYPAEKGFRCIEMRIAGGAISADKTFYNHITEVNGIVLHSQAGRLLWELNNGRTIIQGFPSAEDFKNKIPIELMLMGKASNNIADTSFPSMLISPDENQRAEAETYLRICYSIKNNSTDFFYKTYKEFKDKDRDGKPETGLSGDYLAYLVHEGDGTLQILPVSLKHRDGYLFGELKRDDDPLSISGFFSDSSGIRLEFYKDKEKYLYAHGQKVSKAPGILYFLCVGAVSGPQQITRKLLLIKQEADTYQTSSPSAVGLKKAEKDPRLAAVLENLKINGQYTLSLDVAGLTDMGGV